MDLVQKLLGMFHYRDFLLAALVFIPVERLLSLRPLQKTFRQTLSTDLAYVFISPLLVGFGLTLVVGLVMNGVGTALPSTIAAAMQTQPLALQVVEILIVGDVGQYLIHRLFHAVPFLWKFHAIHHGPEELDWLAAYHVHPLDHIVTQAGSVLPVFILGFSDAAVGIFFVILHWHAILVHANTRLNWGPLNWLLASPQFHHWHHANERHAHNKNFSATFPLIDFVGGTLHMPGKEFPHTYGIDEPPPRRYLEQLLSPFRRRASVNGLGQLRSRQERGTGRRPG